MKIAILGYGKMGKEIEKISLERGHEIVLIIDEKSEREISKKVDVAINFCTPQTAYKNIRLALSNNIPVVSGTTGWLTNYRKIEELSRKKQTGFLYSSNFSLGVNLFFELNKDRKFPVTDIIRKSPRFEEKYSNSSILNARGYTPEPDIFHDIQGHIPFLMNRPYADFMHKVGILGDKILKNERSFEKELVSHNLRRLQNFAWWTYEFGLVKSNPETNHFRRKENDIDYDIYGSGIISSFDETMNIVKCAKGTSNKSKIISYDIEEIVMTSFNYSEIQDRYYVVESMEDLYQSFEENEDLFWFEG